jgi:hypothetical protein
MLIFNFFFLIFGCLASNQAYAEDWHLKFDPDPNTQEIIPGLKWEEAQDTREPKVLMKDEDNEDASTAFVKLHGSFLNKEKDLLFQNKKIELDADGKFNIDVNIESARQGFKLSAVNSAGFIEYKNFDLYFLDYQRFIDEHDQTKKKEKKLKLFSGLSLGVMTYSQVDNSASTINNFNEFSFSLQTGFAYQFIPSMSILGDASITVLPVAVGPSGNVMRLLNVNAGAAYTFELSELPWKFALIGDYSFRTSFQSLSSFGYANISGFTIYPRIERDFPKHKKLWASARYLPLFVGGTNPFNLGSYEFTIQSGYTLFKLGGNWVELLAGVAFFSLQYSYTAASNGGIQSNSYSVGLNYAF